MATISITITRDELCNNRRRQDSNEAIAGMLVLKRLRDKGVPVIGVLGVLTVEWGVLTITHAEGLDGDEWTWSWTGEPMPATWARKCSQLGAALRFDRPLRDMIAEEDEL